MTITTQPPPSAPPPPPQSEPTTGSGRLAGTAGGGIVRVNAFDGLFLRADHLNRMQDYALQLSTALGVSMGAGTVHGFDVTYQNNSLAVAPGLAVAESGRILESDTLITYDLKDETTAGDDFFWIVIEPDDWDFGDEPVQGELCDEPCKPGTTRKGSRDEGVKVYLQRDRQAGLSGQSSSAKRSWGASRLFALEEQVQRRWPGHPGYVLPGLDHWAPPPRSEQPADHVRIGVLIPDDSARWLLDVWTARRDRGDPPPARAAQWRLSMRPWDVFVAQILQFQAHLAELEASGALGGIGQTTALLGRIGFLEAALLKQGGITKAEAAKDLAEIGREFRMGEVAPQGTKDRDDNLPAVGISELPPAGFLAVSQSGDGVGTEVTMLLGGDDAVDVRVCRGHVRDVGGFVARAQHRARIPLTGGVPQPVDILVPDTTAAGQTNWVAFVRREETDCGIEVEPTPVESEPVAVYFLEQRQDEALYQAYEDYLRKPDGTPPELPARPDAELRYPVRTWALPDAPEYPKLIDELRALQDSDPGATVVGVVSDPARRALGGVRAGLFAAKVHESGFSDTQLDLRTMVRAGDEAIVVLTPAVDRSDIG